MYSEGGIQLVAFTQLYLPDCNPRYIHLVASLGSLHVVAFAWLNVASCIQLIAFSLMHRLFAFIWFYSVDCIHLVAFTWLHSSGKFNLGKLNWFDPVGYIQLVHSLRCVQFAAFTSLPLLGAFICVHSI